jgi:hypothetical protein
MPRIFLGHYAVMVRPAQFRCQIDACLKRLFRFLRVHLMNRLEKVGELES